MRIHCHARTHGSLGRCDARKRNERQDPARGVRNKNGQDKEGTHPQDKTAKRRPLPFLLDEAISNCGSQIAAPLVPVPAPSPCDATGSELRPLVPRGFLGAGVLQTQVQGHTRKCANHPFWAPRSCTFRHALQLGGSSFTCCIFAASEHRRRSCPCIGSQTPKKPKRR